ncbi:MAG: sugar phosphate isomerase/epimerase family protein [candidate division FCPU426 bacterium]
MVYLGFADEAAGDIEGQIKATKALGWNQIEARNVDGVNLHNLPDKEFDRVAAALEAAGVGVYCFGSAIANWGKAIDQPFDSSLEEALRAVPRMRRLGTRFIRVMSFAVLKDREPDDQMEAERFKRLNRLQEIFSDAGLIMVHENCMNYGGMGWTYTLRLLENVRGLKLTFDTGNPVVAEDRSKPKPWPRQDAWEFYDHVKEHVAHVHIKDGYYDEAAKKEVFTYPGEGKGQVKKILTDLITRGYTGGLSIEPHLSSVFHHLPENTPARAESMMETYVEYGRRVMAMVDGIKRGA